MTLLRVAEWYTGTRLVIAHLLAKRMSRKRLTSAPLWSYFPSDGAPQEAAMNLSEFDDGFEDDPSAREHAEQMLGEAIMGAPIRALDPCPAVSIPESTPIREAVQLMLDRQIGAVLVERSGRAVGIFTERDVLRRVATTGIDQEREVGEV